jgi:hypothetical protein
VEVAVVEAVALGWIVDEGVSEGVVDGVGLDVNVGDGV